MLKEKFNNENSFKLAIISYQTLESLLIIYKEIKKIENYQKNVVYKDITNIIGEILNVDFVVPLNNFILYTLNLCYKEFLKQKSNNEIFGMICSECPGWVCYAEKKIGNISFQYMSKTRSPHEISAIIIKELFEQYLYGKSSNIDKDLYICSVMPCFDKKIEPIKSKTGINTVISTIELEEKFKEFLNNSNNIINNKIIDINILKKYLKEKQSIKQIKELIYKHINTSENNNNINFSLYEFPFRDYYSSNYYIEFFTYMITQDNPKYYVEKKDGKNNDSKEIIIYSDETKKEVIFRLLLSYGLRNIQNIVRMIKAKKIKYDYIEIMSCPGGCINGSAQIRVNKTRDDIFNDIKKGFDDKHFENDFIKKSIDSINQIVEELKIDLKKFEQTFKEADFSKSDIDW